MAKKTKEATQAATPKTEERALSPLARRAIAMLLERQRREGDELIREILEAEGVTPDDGWQVDAGRGVLVRAVPEG